MKEILEAFDQYLVKRNLHFSATIIGGAALIVLGIIDRTTHDVDCLDPKIPDEIKKASVDFAKSYSVDNFSLTDNWFNNGPASLKIDLSDGWETRLVPLFEGQNLKLQTLGRLDLLKTKLFGYCDRQQDLQDCLALKPTLEELKDCFPWLRDRDANPMWPEHVKVSLETLATRLGYEFIP